MRFLIVLFAALQTLACPCIGQIVGVGRGTPADFNKMPVLDLSTVSSYRKLQLDSKDHLERSERNDVSHLPPLFNEAAPLKSGEIHFSPRYSYNGSYDPFYLSEADQIVTGSINSATAHLTKSNNFVYTIYNFTSSSYVKGGGPADLVLERKGGVILFPNGKKQFVGVFNFGLPTPGGPYLLFLKKTPHDGSLTILNGFYLGDTHVTALDFEAAKLDVLTPAQLISAIKQKLTNDAR